MKRKLLLSAALAGLFVLLPVVVTAESDPPFVLPHQTELLRLRSAVLHTNKGTIFIRLFPEAAPWHVANLKYLADKGFYRNMAFHRYQPNFLIQTGAPGPIPSSGPPYTLPAEFSEFKHEEGTLTMVRKPDELDLSHTRRSHGSQFIILLRRASHLDGQYVIFGNVVQGMEIVRNLRQGDIIRELYVFVRPDTGINGYPPQLSATPIDPLRSPLPRFALGEGFSDNASPAIP